MVLILTNIQPERTFETKLKEFCSVDRSFPFHVDMGCIVMVEGSIVEPFECQTLCSILEKHGSKIGLYCLNH